MLLAMISLKDSYPAQPLTMGPERDLKIKQVYSCFRREYQYSAL